MDSAPLRVLVANDPLAYRETMAVALSDLRPGIEVITGEPDELDVDVVRLAPHLVLCSRLTEVVEAQVPAWLLLYPEAARLAVTSVAGERSATGDVDLPGLLALVDRVASLTAV